MENNPFDEDNQNDAPSAFDDSAMKPIEDDSNPRPRAWMLLGGAALLCGLFFSAAFLYFQPDAKSLADLYFPSATPTFTRTPTQTPTPTFTRTPTQTPTPNWTATQKVIQSTETAQAVQNLIADVADQWNILISDAFDTNENNWVTGADTSERLIISRKMLDGKYRWEAKSIKGFIAWVTADTKSVTDFYLTVEAERVDGSSSSDYGLVFREDNKTNFYYFGIEDDGFFLSLTYNDEWIHVIEWTQSPAIVRGGSNRLTVIAQGSHFIFLINDQHVADAIDERLPKGTVALAVEIYDPDLQAVFEFDNFELVEP